MNFAFIWNKVFGQLVIKIIFYKTQIFNCETWSSEMIFLISSEQHPSFTKFKERAHWSPNFEVIQKPHLTLVDLFCCELVGWTKGYILSFTLFNYECYSMIGSALQQKKKKKKKIIFKKKKIIYIFF